MKTTCSAGACSIPAVWLPPVLACLVWYLSLGVCSRSTRYHGRNVARCVRYVGASEVSWLAALQAAPCAC
jgi:hypothetical protein